MMKENGLYYEEIKKLMSVKAKKEYVSVTYGRIKQEVVIECKVEYCEVNYFEYEHKQEVDRVKSRPCLIDSEYIVCKLIEDQKVEYYEIIEDQNVECCKLIEDKKAEIIGCCELIEDQNVEIIEWCGIIEDQKIEYCETIEDQKVEYCEIIEDEKVEYYELIEDQKVEIIEHQKVEDINMFKSSRSEMKKINLSKEELRVIARERGVKNYDNISKSRLIKVINKLKPSKGLKKEENPIKIFSSLLLKQKRNIRFEPRKKSKKDVYKPIKISGVFSDNYVEYKSDCKKDKSIPIASYLNKIREYLRKTIDDKRRI